MTNKWCEHLTKGEKFYSKHLDPMELVFQGEHWKFCPICGTKCPEPEKKTLAQELHAVYWPNTDWNGLTETSRKAWNPVAQKAREVILDGKEQDLAFVLSEALGKDKSALEVSKAILDFLREEAK